MRFALAILFAIALSAITAAAQPLWQAELDSRIAFYQLSDLGPVLAGTERSLYAIDPETGSRIWRRTTGPIAETAVAPVPGTDLMLVSRDLGKRSQIEAVDVVSGDTIWRGEKVKGDVMQLAADPLSDALVVTLIRDPFGTSGDEFKRTPIILSMRLSTGDLLWKRELDSDVAMMPSRFDGGSVAHSLDNYRAPLIVDGRVFLFYEGATSYDLETGKEKARDDFKVNEGGLALTEADPIVDERHVYMSGRGRIRAIDRKTGDVVWKGDDVGTAAEMALLDGTLYVRTGGRFTRVKNGESETKGPFGVAAIDAASGKVLWRFKDADKGLTNFTFPDAWTIAIADGNDLITLDARSGKRLAKQRHKIEDAQFLILNEARDLVVGGRDTIAAFRSGAEQWRVRHKAPARGALRIVAGIALRATALYFRYGGAITSAVGLARTGVGLASAVNSFRWSGLAARVGGFDLTTLASNAARGYALRRVYSYGRLGAIAGGVDRGVGSVRLATGVADRLRDIEIVTPRALAARAGRGVIDRSLPDSRESVFDRFDPARYADRLADVLLRRKRLAELRSNHMYYYTDLDKPFDRKGLVGVNINTGGDARIVLVPDPDPGFVVDEVSSLFFNADGRRLQAFEMIVR